MKRTALVVLALLLVVSVGCLGPRQLTRGVDDWVNQQYVDCPWLIGNVVSTGLISVAFWVTGVIDSVIDMYYFWVEDAQPFGDGVGTEFVHKAVVVPSAK